jgi:hypothetical protein
MSSQPTPNSSPDANVATEHLTKAQTLLKSLESRIGQHPELGQAIHKIESALAILGVQTGAML